MEVKVTVYITGANASAGRAKELNALAKNTFKSQKVDGAEVGFNVNYINEKDLKPGENILDFVNKTGRSQVNAVTVEYGNNKYHYTGNTGSIYLDGDSIKLCMNQGVIFPKNQLFEVGFLCFIKL